MDILAFEKKQHLEELAIFEELRKYARILGTQIVEPIVGIRVEDRDGNIKSERIRHSHSLTRNMAVCATILTLADSYGTLYSDGHLVGKATDGSTGSIFFVTGYDSPANNDDYGCLCGRDNTAESFDDFELGNQIFDGNGLNQMEHVATVDTGGWNGGSEYWWRKFSRPFDNDSGNPITVEEVALVVSAGGFYMMARDLISGGQVVADGDRLFVDYELRASY